MNLAWAWVLLVGHVGAVGPLVGTVAVPQYQCLARLEDVLDGHEFRNGSAEAAGQAATAAVRVEHRPLSVPKPPPGGWDAETDQWGREGLEALRDHLHCSESMVQEDIRDPPDSVVQDSDGVESVAAQMVHHSAQLDSPGWGTQPEPASEGRHSRTGWRGGNHLWNTDSVVGCRHHGRLDSLRALPVDCTAAVHLNQTGRSLHSVLWSGPEDTSSVRGSLGTAGRP